MRRQRHIRPAKVVRSLEDLLGNSAVDLVVVATPNDTHFNMARRALEAGKHVVIDKPFAATSAEAAELLALAKRKGVQVCPFHNRRWDGDFLTVKMLLAESTLGRVVTVESHFDRYRPLLRDNTWKDSAGEAQGLLMDLGPHLVDQAVALYGMPKTLTASVRRDRDDKRLEDAFDLALHYEVDGQSLLYWCRSSMLAADNSPRFLVHGTAGSFRKYGLDPQEPTLVAGGKVPPLGADEVWLQEDEAMWGTLTIARDLNEPGKLEANPGQDTARRLPALLCQRARRAQRHGGACGAELDGVRGSPGCWNSHG